MSLSLPLCVLLIASCTILTVNSMNKVDLIGRIVNGEEINSAQFPWMTWMHFVGRDDIGWYNATCGGSLISSSPPIVLTAAHCVDFKDDLINELSQRPDTNLVDSLYVDINRTYTKIDNHPHDEYETLFFDPSQIHIHPEYDTITLKNDIALIIFDFNQTITMEIDPLPVIPSYQLNINQSCCIENELFTAIGYGRNVTDGYGTKTLQKTILKYVDTLTYWILLWPLVYNTTANETFLQQYMYSDGTIMYLLGNDTSTCQGDSGGPAFRYNDDNVPEIMGLTSFGNGGCNNGVPSGFTSVAHYTEWIMDTINCIIYDDITCSPTMEPTMDPTAVRQPTIDSGDDAFRYRLGLVFMFMLFCVFCAAF